MKKITLSLTIILGMLFSASVVMAQDVEVTPFLKSNESVVYADQTEAIWDILLSFNTVVGGEQGIGTNGTDYFTCKWSANAFFNRYNASGVKQDSFSISGVSAIRDLAYDGTYFYGSNNSTSIKKMTFNPPALVSSISAGVAAVRHCAYDPSANGGAGGLWVGGWADLALVSMTGSLISSVSGLSLAGMYGTAWDNVTPGGPYLWIFDQGAGAGTPQLIQQFSIPNLTLTGVTHDVSDLPGYQGGATSIAGGLEASSSIISNKFVLLANVQQTPNLVGVYEIAIISGVNNPEINTVVNVYPNPAKDYVKVSSSIYPILNVEVVNYLGQTVYQDTPGTVELKINTSDFETGFYFVRVQTKDGMATHKIAVQ